MAFAGDLSEPMQKPSDNPADPFKKALAEATKTMAHDPDLTVTYSVDPPGMTGDAMRLPQVSRRLTRDEVLLARGTADAFALRRRYHDDATHSRYQPTGPMAREGVIFTLLCLMKMENGPIP